MNHSNDESFAQQLERACAPSAEDAASEPRAPASGPAPASGAPSIFWRYLLPTVILIAAGFAAWAALQPVKLVVRASGEVASSGPDFTFRLPSGVKISEALVGDGQMVALGDPIFRVDRGLAVEALERAETELIRLQLEAERLKALIESRPPDFAEIAAGYPQELAAWTAKWREGLNKILAAQSLLDGEIELKRRDEARTKDALALAKRQARLAADQEAIREAAAKSGVVSREVYLETAQARVAADSAAAEAKDKAETATEALEKALTQRKTDDEQRTALLRSRLKAVVHSQVGLVQEVFTLQELVQTQTVKAPRGGRIKGVADAVAARLPASGAVALRIENSGGMNVELRAQVPAGDIGEIQVGQVVGVRLPGALPWRPDLAQGKIGSISAGYVLDEARKLPFYTAIIRLERGRDDTASLLVPGVAVTAEIQVGQKPLWQWLLAPSLQAEQ